MIDWLMAHEPQVRLTLFLSILGLMLLAEWRWPRRQRREEIVGRWISNLGMVFIGALLIRLLLPVVAVGVAIQAQAASWGLFHTLDLPLGVEILLAILMMDLIITLQHLLFHATPLLWRLHRVHHADLDMDSTTGVRFHPLEILLSMVIKLGMVAALGPHPAAVILFEVILNGMALFNHGNVAIPRAVDRYLRLLVVTPDMHRIHHSIHRDECDSNYGFNLSLWDRLFGTYRAAPRDGQQTMQLGIEAVREPAKNRLLPLLLLPLKKM